MASSLVSVIVLNFNGQEIIGKCLNHLLAQTYPEFEIIVVDNNSRDGSLGILQEYLGTGKLSVVQSKRNIGVPGGRNLAVLYARGDVIAFIDNDGYADKNWLTEAVRTLGLDPGIGAVASVVFFSRRKIILNGAGGTMNLQGHGGDLCFNAPYEFAELPDEVLYPMGCGMVVRRNVLEKIGPLDRRLFNYYDDVELGIRIWRSGFRVVVAPNAWIDYDCSYSDRFLKNKVYLCERNRIRTVLKYYPARRLLAWFWREWYFLRYVKSPALFSIPCRAWAWNLFHLPSALGWRYRFSSRRGSFEHLLQPSCAFPPPVPNNELWRPDLRRARERLIVGGADEHYQLNFGWYWVECRDSIRYRWTEAHASAVFRLSRPARSMSIRLRGPESGCRATISVRRLGDIDAAASIRIDDVPTSWQQRSYLCELGPGTYELLLSAERTFRDLSGRILGVAVASIEFS